MNTQSREVTMEALKPCPFCGGAATLSDGESGDFNVCCHSRDCFGPHTALYYLRSDAITAWNTRATPEPVAPTPSPAPDIAGLVERLKTGVVRTGDSEDGEYELYDIEEAETTMYEAVVALQRVAQERDAAIADSNMQWRHWQVWKDRAEAAEARIATARDEGLEMAAAILEAEDPTMVHTAAIRALKGTKP